MTNSHCFTVMPKNLPVFLSAFKVDKVNVFLLLVYTIDFSESVKLVPEKSLRNDRPGTPFHSYRGRDSMLKGEGGL